MELYHTNDATRNFTLRRTGSSRAQAVALVAAHLATHMVSGSALLVDAEPLQLCNSSAVTLLHSFAQFSEVFHTVNGLTMSNFVTCVVAVTAHVVVAARVNPTTASLLYRLTCWLLASLRCCRA
ncbi:hypothetical protein NXY56_007777 [Leishmania guyanensis]